MPVFYFSSTLLAQEFSQSLDGFMTYSREKMRTVLRLTGLRLRRQLARVRRFAQRTEVTLTGKWKVSRMRSSLDERPIIRPGEFIEVRMSRC